MKDGGVRDILQVDVAHLTLDYRPPGKHYKLGMFAADLKKPTDEVNDMATQVAHNLRPGRPIQQVWGDAVLYDDERDMTMDL